MVTEICNVVACPGLHAHLTYFDSLFALFMLLFIFHLFLANKFYIFI